MRKNTWSVTFVQSDSDKKDTSRNIWRCGCNDRFTRPYNLSFTTKSQIFPSLFQTHIERIRKYKCEICDMAYYVQRTLNRHMKYAHSIEGRKRFRCPNALCDKFYSSVSSFRSHACVDGKRPPSFLNAKCSMCSKQYFNQFELNRHINRAHHADAPQLENVTCNSCNKSYSYRYWDLFVQHVAQKCPKTIRYECDYCSTVLKSKTKLIEHFVNRHNFACEAKALPCPKCDKLFFKKNSLSWHLKTNHLQYKCNRCHKICHSKSGLSLHKKRCSLQTSSTSRNFECPACNVKFSHKKSYQRHLTESKCNKTAKLQGYQCEACAKIYSRKSSLGRHVRKQHSDESEHRVTREQFSCDVCDKSFHQKRSLLNHFRNGDHRTSFECEFCRAIFKRITGYKTHIIHCKENKKKEEA